MIHSKVFIIILQYNNSQDTIECLESIKELDYPSYEIIVVDNASDEEHYSNVRLFLESQYKLRRGDLYFEIIANKENTGYSGGNNVGIRRALERGADYVLILNPDSGVPKDLLNKLLEKIESNEKIGIIAPVTDEGSSFQDKQKVYGGKIEWLKPELRHIENPMLSNYLPDDMYIPGNAILIKKEVFDRTNLFDERYFLYFEDADFCIRARQSGFKLVIVNDVMVQHKVSSTTSKLGSAKILRYHYRNAHLFNIRFSPPIYKILLPFWSIWIIIKQLLKICFLPGKRLVSLAILKGVLDFYLHRLGCIK